MLPSPLIDSEQPLQSDFTDLPNPPSGSSVLHLRLEIRELREGFRPGPIVMFRPQGLPQVKLPPEEHVQNMADR